METQAPKRLSKVLASAGVASRRACEELIFSGKVAVNGSIVRVPQTLVQIGVDRITVSGKAIVEAEEKVYFILNKPRGYICSNVRVGTKKLITDLFKDLPYRLFTVGRLDRDTTGLLIVTNDGHFTHKVIHPSSNIVKEYVIKTQQEITHQHLISISNGTWIEGARVRPFRVRKIRKGTLKIAVKEGKKREVRLLAENAGLTVLELCRVRIGELQLGDIPEGMYRPMTEIEKTYFLSSKKQLNTL